MIALLVITDGRDDYLARTMATTRHLVGPVTERWMFDDTGDPAYRALLAQRFPQFRHINGGGRQGFGGAIRAAWSALATASSARYVFHLEQDFAIQRDVDLDEMAAVLDEQPHLAQLALRRQAWNDVERAAGGVVEAHPDAYADRVDDRGRAWLEHRLFFTSNPTLYRSTLIRCRWPAGDRSEGAFTHHLLTSGTPDVAGDRVRFGYWGRRTDEPWVQHIGVDRAGVGY